MLRGTIVVMDSRVRVFMIMYTPPPCPQPLELAFRRERVRARRHMCDVGRAAAGARWYLVICGEV